MAGPEDKHRHLYVTCCNINANLYLFKTFNELYTFQKIYRVNAMAQNVTFNIFVSLATAPKKSGGYCIQK